MIFAAQSTKAIQRSLKSIFKKGFALQNGHLHLSVSSSMKNEGDFILPNVSLRYSWRLSKFKRKSRIVLPSRASVWAYPSRLKCLKSQKMPCSCNVTNGFYLSSGFKTLYMVHEGHYPTFDVPLVSISDCQSIFMGFFEKFEHSRLVVCKNWFYLFIFSIKS